MPARNSPLSLNQRVIDIGNELRRLRTAINGLGTSGFDPNADPVVIGNGAASTDVGGVAIGKNAAAPGTTWGYTGNTDNIAIGEFTQAGGNANNDQNNVAIGYNANAYNGHATAVGSQALVDGAHGSAFGHQANAGGAHSVAIGYNSYCAAAADTGICIGDGTVNSDSGISIGANLVTGFAGVAIGHTAQSTIDYQITLGGASHFVEIPGDGLVLHDSGGGRWRVTVTTGGALSVAAA